MNPDTDHSYFRAQELRTAAKARLVKLAHDDSEHWVPLSVSDWHREDTLVVETWFARKEGME